MHATRRQFLGATLLASGAVLLRPAAARARPARAGTYFEWKKAGDRARVAFGEGGNAMVVAGDGGALLVDCKNAPFGTTLRREAKDETAELTTVINTHHHADHTGGNAAFTPDLLVYAHERARPRVLEQFERYRGQVAGGIAQASRSTSSGQADALEDAKAAAEKMDRLRPEDFAPSRTLGDHEELEVGGLRIAVHHFGAGHTDNDVVVHLPELNLVHAGDLLFHRLYPFWDASGGVSGDGWIRALESVLVLCDERTVVVPGHGEITDRTGIEQGIAVLGKIRDAAKEAIRSGMTRDEFIKTEIPEFKDFGMAGVAKSRAFGGWYDELSR